MAERVVCTEPPSVTDSTYIEDGLYWSIKSTPDSEVFFWDHDRFLGGRPEDYNSKNSEYYATRLLQESLDCTTLPKDERVRRTRLFIQHYGKRGHVTLPEDWTPDALRGMVPVNQVHWEKDQKMHYAVLIGPLPFEDHPFAQKNFAWTSILDLYMMGIAYSRHTFHYKLGDQIVDMDVNEPSTEHSLSA